MKSGQTAVLGIDGGGTRSLAVAVDLDGQILATAKAGSLNFFGAGLAEAQQNLKRLISSIDRQLPTKTRVTRVVVGCAALFTDATDAEKRRLCGGIVPESRTRVVSDCQTAWFGATLGRPGVVVVTGTGSIVLTQSRTGELCRIGGWGHILGDEGSAYWIALESVKAAVLATERRGPNTSLARHVCDWFGVNELVELIPIIHQSGFAKEKFAALSGFLADGRARRDLVFRRICRRAGQALAGQTLAAAKVAGLKIKSLPVHLVGSVVERNSLVRKSLIAALEKERSVRVCRPALSPVLGAAALALRDAGIELSPMLTKQLAASYRNAARVEVRKS
ncbi:MAG TPA: BadF/BadG/BcrA/BcrD ATPase family protein [Candidatus Angelobacter sp.]|nr:BadF/BadG/BcrA/BcrD ATPase family protein [Candidatus Angelobacter sp.]